MEKDFEYYAFISYKREDEKWAKWLQGKLEGYRLPAVIRKEIPRLPKRIRPIFRDKTDLGAGMLSASLTKELEKSRYLIVICSPRSAQSDWVGKEITEFVKMGRAARIIPFIVEGEPNSNNERECFHPIIKKEIPDMLGININEIGKQQAFVKVAAKLLDLNFDALWNRFLREQRKQRVIAAVAGLLLLVGAGFVWDYFFRTKVDYYADYVDKKGTPKGIIKLSKSEMQKRNRHYRFENRQDKLRRVVYANSAGTPVNHANTEHTDRFAIQILSYTDNRLSVTELKNAQGKTIVAYLWGGDDNFDSIDIRDRKSGGSGAALASSFTSMSNLFEQNSNKANIKRFKLTRDNDGYIIRKEFKRNNGDDTEPASDANDIWGFEYEELDSLGRPEKLYYLGKDYIRLPDKTGIMGRKYKYDKYGNISQTEYFDKDNKLVFNEQSWAVGIEVSNSDGNIIESSFLGIDREPCYTKDGYAKMKLEYNSRGNNIKQTYFGIDGNPCMSKDGYAKIEAQYDRYGNMKEIAFLGIDGEPCYSKNGFAKLKRECDGNGNVKMEACFGTDDNPCYNKDGFAKWTAKYDNYGNTTEWALFDINGNSCYGKDGFAKLITKYDKRGDRMEEQASFGPDGNSCFSKDGYAKYTQGYDDLGNINRGSFFAPNGNSYNSKHGFAKFTRVYNNLGNLKQDSYFGPDGNLCKNKDGYAVFIRDWKYDDLGNTIEEIVFLGTDKTPCLNNDGYAKITLKYNERGNITETAFFGLDGTSCLHNKEGVAKMTQKYNEQGKRVEEEYFGTDGAPLLRQGEAAKFVMKYDERGNMIEQAYFGIDGTPRLQNTDIAKMTLEYDVYGNMIERTYLGIDGTPQLHNTGIAKTTQKYDLRGNMIEQAFFGADDNLAIMLENDYAKLTAKYDVYGNLAEVIYFGVDDTPCLNNENIARWTRIYDYWGNVTDGKQYGINDELLATSITFLFVRERDSAYHKGLRDILIVLEYCDWEFGNTLFDMYTKTIPDNIEKDKTLVVMNDAGQIDQYKFGKGQMNLWFVSQEITGEEFYNIEKQYNEWKYGK